MVWTEYATIIILISLKSAERQILQNRHPNISIKRLATRKEEMKFAAKVAAEKAAVALEKGKDMFRTGSEKAKDMFQEWMKRPSQ
jgi:hypothetical protein